MSAKKKVAATAAAKAETLVYVGPSLIGVAMHNTFYTNGVTQALRDAAAAEPAFKNLIIPISKLAAAQADIDNRRGAIYAFYEKAATYKL